MRRGAVALERGERENFVKPLGLAEQEALRLRAAELHHRRELGAGFDALGDGRHAEARGELDDRSHGRARRLAPLQLLHEGTSILMLSNGYCSRQLRLE